VAANVASIRIMEKTDLSSGWEFTYPMYQDREMEAVGRVLNHEGYRPDV
jgi:hypothetical protein